MNVAGESGVRRDFSDLAILRASVAAIMAAYLTLVVLNYMVYVLLFRGGTDLLVAIEAFPLFLTRAFDPMLMFEVLVLQCLQGLAG